ncbi:vitamin B12-binding protein precursor [Clostridium acetireducens DSM 10703]|jgi:iron complex transport system substrate-binding protein|uniref:Vitamin B12-binding protein n=1 Tax=Clostridium acetireducens DSM 10703 TaxID=1121290 RepID=A0A1E8F003_9CLOT|nr:ABC transporter substrate-binding protein [Clostridium acetireducens]OFI06715.1 vitamin B12-binding protein precursor [Clostridium acetireducens DSM 10703]
MKKKLLIVLTLLTFIITFSACTNNKNNANNAYKIEITDDSGEKIKLEKPAEKIISLYSAHTENLFSLGLDKEVIGVSDKDAYPPQAIDKKTFSYKDDAESIIGAKPDLVLIRPFIEKTNPKLVKDLKNSGIAVVSLYPKSFKEFDEYIKKLGILTGKQKKAEEVLKEFNKELKEIEKESESINPKVKVFFESTDTNCRTVTKDSMAAYAIKLAGGINIAEDAKPTSSTSSIASFGEEKILAKADSIDVYVAQKGAMNAGGNPHAISIRPGFQKIKAVKEKRVYNINEKLISSPTFRFVKGVRELQRIFYTDKFDNIDSYNNDNLITKSDLAHIIVKFKHIGIYSPTTKSYAGRRNSHVYGSFKDVKPEHENFDYIETAVMGGYFDEKSEEFYPNKKVNREDLAKVLYMLADLPQKDVEIKDIDNSENKLIIKTIVGNGIMNLENNEFKPESNVTGKEVLQSLNKIKQYMK